MGIVFGMMVPHPPVIMKEVGGGREKIIEKTAKAYESVSKKAAACKPDVLLISSPHSILYNDYFHVSPGEGACGDMGKFGAGDVKFSVKYDIGLLNKIDEIAKRFSFPAGTAGEGMINLDHGTMVPLYFLLKEMPNVKIVRVSLSGLSKEEHYLMGKIIKIAAEEENKRVCFVSSGDLSHKLKEDGPYGISPEGEIYDKRIMDVMGKGDFSELFYFDEEFLDKAAECGHRSFLMMAGAFDGKALSSEALSHEGPFGVGYGICCYEPAGDDEDRLFLNHRIKKIEEEKEIKRRSESAFVRLARKTIEKFVLSRTLPDKDFILNLTEDEEEKELLFNERRGVFVSIHKDGRLRGCIGTFLPTEDSVSDEIIKNAISASLYDKRFFPVRGDEVSLLDITVDILSAPEKISDRSKLDPKKYGVIVSSGNKKGLLLPDLDGVDTVEEQIMIAMDKAGIGEDEEISLERFNASRYY